MPSCGAAMPSRHPVTADVVVSRRLVIPAGELVERFSRSSGPGGQGVNTTDSRVELTFDVAQSLSVPATVRARLLDQLSHRLIEGRLTVVASEHRAQLANRKAARVRLVTILRDALAPGPRARRATAPTRGAVRRRLGAKARRSRIKADRRRPDPTD